MNLSARKNTGFAMTKLDKITLLDLMPNITQEHFSSLVATLLFIATLLDTNEK